MQLLKYCLAALLALFVLTPLALAVGISLNPDANNALATLGSWRAFWPESVGIDSYIAVWTDPFHPMARYMLNTVIIASAVVVASVLVNSALAFALACGGGAWRGYAITAIIALIAVPTEALVLPQLLMVSRAGLLDSYAAQILPLLANALFIFLFHQFFSRLPRELLDAARIDGMSLARRYWHIGLPAARPLCACVAVLQFMAIWNSYLWPVMVSRTADSRPLSVAMAAYFESNQIAWNSVMAFAISAALPVVLFFLVMQRRFVASFTEAAIKR